MKKLFTLGLSLFLAVGSFAQGDVRRLWDFTQGFSEETIENLMADAASGTGYWTNKGTWFETKARTAGPLTAMVNGQQWVIPETEGLTIGAQSAQHFNIVLEHSDGPHIWLNGKRTEDYIIIPSVPAGDTITVVYASHSGEEKRGFKVSTSGVVGYYDGATQWTTVGKKDTVVLVNNNEDPTDVKLTATNGMHFFYICVGEKPNDVKDTPKIGYVLDSTYPGYTPGSEGNYIDDILGLFSERMRYERVDIDVSTDLSLVTVDSLEGFDVVIVSPYVSTDNQFLQTVKQAVAFTPVLNLNPAVSAAWGYGSVVESSSNLLKVSSNAVSSPLFVPNDPAQSGYINADGTLQFLYEQGYNVVGFSIPEGSYFAADSVIATTMDGTPAIHIHNMNRNAYMLLPYPNPDFIAESAYDILPNAIMMLCDTKSEVVTAYKPTVSQEYHHLYTTVTLKSSTDGAKIYYTTDGSEPTTESTLYTGPFDINQKGVTVKASAIADGYLLSEPREQVIDIFELAAAPSISCVEESGKTTVTITGNEDGAALYYNFDGNNSISESTPYTVPVELTYPTTIYAFAGEVGDKLASEAVSQKVNINGKEERLDVVSHFNANSADWSMGESKTKYYTEGKKNGYPYYSVTSHVETLPDGNDTIIVDSKDPLWTLTEVNPGKGWTARTYGQGMLWERITISSDIDDNNTTDRYRGDTSFDQGASDNTVSFGNVQKSDGVENDPYSCFIMSTEALQGPFDIVTYIGNGSTTNHPKATLWVSTDTTSTDNWVMVDSVFAGSKYRFIKKNIASYEGTDKVFVKLQAEFSSVMVMDIKIMNAGELTGIKGVNEADEAAGEVVSTQVYSINGTQLATPAKGINIIKEVYANGVVKTKKVVVK